MAHSIEIRERVVDAYSRGLGSYQTIAIIFNIGSATVKRWVWRQRDTGGVAPAYCGGVKPLIDEKGLSFLSKLLSKSNDLTLVDLTNAYNKKKKAGVSVSTIGRAVRQRIKLTRKKRLIVPSNATLQKTKS